MGVWGKKGGQNRNTKKGHAFLGVFGARAASSPAAPVAAAAAPRWRRVAWEREKEAASGAAAASASFAAAAPPPALARPAPRRQQRLGARATAHRPVRVARRRRAQARAADSRRGADARVRQPVAQPAAAWGWGRHSG